MNSSNTSSNSNNDSDINVDFIEEAKPMFRSMEIRSSYSADSLRETMIRRQFSNLSNKDIQISSSSSTFTNGNNKTRWGVIKAKPLPAWPIVERKVYIDADASIVAARIEDSLRLRSVEAKFDNNEAQAYCKTSNMVHYNVCLYSDAASADGNGTYVEVMRMRGCGYSFRMEREAILNAAKGFGGDQSASTLTSGLASNGAFAPCRKLKIPPSLMKLYVPPTIFELENILDKALDQFHDKDRHVMLFSLQNLVSMTSVANKSHTETAHTMSRLIMQTSRINVRDAIVSIYMSEVNNMRDETSELICNACLTILSNGIESLSISKHGAFLNEECSKHFIDMLVPNLVKGIESCDCTHGAYLALKCLSLLVGVSSLACEKARDVDIQRKIEKAELYGRREHLNLERVARSTINVLQC